MELQNEIAQLAYELYEIGDRKEGRDLANWLEAERIILSAHRQSEENLVQDKAKTETTEASKVDPFSETEKEATLV
jgi:Protein of unknown function (DUF2934)